MHQNRDPELIKYVRRNSRCISLRSYTLRAPFCAANASETMKRGVAQQPVVVRDGATQQISAGPVAGCQNGKTGWACLPVDCQCSFVGWAGKTPAVVEAIILTGFTIRECGAARDLLLPAACRFQAPF